MFTNLHIRTRLILLIVVATSLMVALRLEGVWRAHQISYGLTSLYELRVVPISELKRISDDVATAMVRTPQKVRLGLMSPTEASAAIDAAWRRLEEVWPRYAAGIDSANEQQLAHELRARLDEARRASMVSRDLMAKNDIPGLDRAFGASLLPLAEEVTERTAALVNLNFELARRTHQEAGDEYRTGLMLSGALALIALGIVFALARSIVGSITRSLGGVTSQLRALSAGEGNLAARMPVVGDDEVAELCTAFNGVMDKLQSLVRRVQEAGIKVASSATELAATSKQQEATVAEQAASTNEVESAARQIARTASELAHTMDEVSTAAEQAVGVAATGRANLVQMEDTIRNVQEASRSIADRLATINAKAANITGIVTTITKVADQTNLLSLNASIEAAKAGEFGQGFGVVAREIRRLADQTAVATLDIEQTVKEVQAAVSSGVMSMEKFTQEVRATVENVSQVSAQLGHVIDEVNVLGPRFVQVGQGATSQSQGAQQISAAMTELSASAGQTADALRESGRAIAQLNEAARELQREVARFAGA